MSELNNDPVPGIKISEDGAETLPLVHFHLVVIVEPDPDTYMVLPHEEEALDLVLDHLLESFNAEFDPEREPVGRRELWEDVDETRLAWLSYEADDYFITFVEDNPVNVYFRLADPDDLEAFRDYLTGIGKNHPHWRVAVIGGMYEDDVMRTAGLVKEAGLETTILTRYCLSSKSFVNLDELADQELIWDKDNFEEDI